MTAIEALKRYLILELIEKRNMNNSDHIMTGINNSALETAKVIKEISTMFDQPNQNNPFQQPQPSQQQQYQTNQSNPFQQQYQPPQYQPPQYQPPQFQQQSTNYMDVNNRLNEMNSMIINVQNEMFKAIQNMNSSFAELAAVLKGKIIK